MRDNLQLKYFEKENVNGTYNLYEEATFFNSKIMDIEDEIIIDDKSIQYYQVDEDKEIGIGYQYQDSQLSLYNEKFKLLDLVNLKLSNHTINLVQQTKIDLKSNTKWEIKIDARTILKEYLFANIKRRRTFKSLKPNNFTNKNINESIYDYISANLLDRYQVSNVNLYIKYIDIKDNSRFISQLLKQYDPQYKLEVNDDEYYVKNANIEQKNLTDFLAEVKLNYSQIKSSTDYKFDYYYEILYKKI